MSEKRKLTYKVKEDSDKALEVRNNLENLYSTTKACEEFDFTIFQTSITVVRCRVLIFDSPKIG